MNISEMAELIASTLRKRGINDEVMLYRMDSGRPEQLWEANACNSSDYALLGETEGRYRVNGATAEEAVQKLLDAVIAQDYCNPSS